MDDEAPAPPPPKLPVPDIKHAIGLCLGFGVLYLLACILAYAIARGAFGVPEGSSWLVAMAFAGVTAWPAILWIAAGKSNGTWRECYPFRRYSTRIILPLVLAYIGTTIVLSEVAALIPMSKEFQDSMKDLSDAPWYLQVFVGIVIAPVAEEMLFRGWMLRGFLAHYSVRKAVVVSSLFFAVAHLNPWQAAIGFPLGMLNAWLVMKTASLWPAILAHATANSMWAVLSPVLERVGYTSEAIEAADHVPLPILAAGAITAAVGWFFLRRSIGRAGPALVASD